MSPMAVSRKVRPALPAIRKSGTGGLPRGGYTRSPLAMLTLGDALLSARICPCACHATLSREERAAGVRALYHCDDALRGWGYAPIYELHGDALWREAQVRETQRDGESCYRGVAVRFGECVYRRLLGSMLHECIHASVGDVTKANYGIPFGLPYGVPTSVPPSEEEAFLAPFNFGEARAFVGVWILGRALFGIDWDLRTARDVGTYGFVGGNALVPAHRGYRAIAHLDRTHHTDRYYTRARKLETEARDWFTAESVNAMIARLSEAAAKGRASRAKQWPDPDAVARLAPKKVGRNEPCTCGSGRKVKQCCGDTAGGSAVVTAMR
jgi:hypothetical protein